MKTGKRVLLGSIAVLAVLLAACAQSAQTSAPGGSQLGSGVDGAVGPALRAEPAPAKGETSAAERQPGIPVAQAFDPDRALILTASVAMRAKEPWSVSDKVQSITLGLGGDVLSLAQSGSGDQRNATLTVRIPQARFNDALRQIRDIADVEVLSSNVEGKDVTDQFVDLQARLAAKQAEEQRYVALLARANTIDEILKIDQTLSQVRTQIEQLTAQVNSIKARTTYSTITVQVSPLIQVVPTQDPTAYDPSKTFERALASLTAIGRVMIDAAIWGLVFGWIPLVLFAIALLLGRTRPRVTPTA